MPFNLKIQFSNSKKRASEVSDSIIFSTLKSTVSQLIFEYGMLRRPYITEMFWYVSVPSIIRT